MVLETETGINITDLVLAEPNREEPVVFDPKKVVTSEIATGLITNLERERDLKNWSSFLSQAATLRIVFPERTRNLGVDGRDWRKCLTAIHEARVNSIEPNLQMTMDLLVLHPDRMDRLKLPAGWDKMIKSTLDQLNWLRQFDYQYTFNALALKFLYPEQFSASYVKEDILAKLKAERQKLVEDGDDRELAMAANIKMLFPDEQNLITGDYLDLTIKTLNYFSSRGMWVVYSKLLREVAIVTTTKVEIADHQIHLAHGQRTSLEGVQPLPEVRQF